MNEKPHDKMPFHNIDDLFRSAIEPFEESPSTDVWGNVEKDLDRYHVINIKRKYNNFKKVAVALVLILCSALMYEFQTQQTIIKEVQSANTTKVDLSAANTENNSNRKRESNNFATSNLPQTPRLSVTSVKKYDAVDGSKLIAPSSATHAVKKPSEQFKTTDGTSYQSSVFTPPYLKVNRNSKGPFEKIVSDNNYSNIDINRTTELSLSPTSPSAIDLLSGNAYANLVNSDVNISKYHQPLVVKSTPGEHKSFGLARRSSFSLSLIFSPDFTSRLIKEDWPVNREDKLEEIRKSERYAFSYSLGALVDYRRNKHWAIQSGFTLSRAVINIDPKFIFARPDDLGDVKFKFNSSSGYSYLSPHSMSRPAFGDSLHAFSSTSSLLYLSIPLSLKYNIAHKKFNFYASAGAAANILIKDKIETSLGNMMNREDAVNHNIKGLKPVYYSALLAAGVSYSINKSIAVSFTPTTRLALTSINKDAPVKSYQQSVGLVAGVQIGL